MYKVTLSMPIYNVAPYIERALLSALNQSFESIEFLLVDDRGSDNSMEIVRRIIETHPRGKDVRIIQHPHNIGTGGTKNTAIDNAKGEYLFFMDSDDEITKDCIQVLYDKMKEHPVDLVVASRNRIRLNGDIIPDYNYEDVIFSNNRDILDYHFNRVPCKNNIHIETWNKLYDLSFLRKSKIRCVPNQLNEDNMFTTKLLFAINSCALISNVTYSYYEIKSSTTGRVVKGYSKRIADQYIDIVNFHKENIDKLHNNLIFKGYHKWLIYYISTRISGYLKGCFLEVEKKNYIDSLVKDIPFSISSLIDKNVLFRYLFILSPFFFKRMIFRLKK